MVSKEKAALARERQKEKRKEREALEKEKRKEREALEKEKRKEREALEKEKRKEREALEKEKRLEREAVAKIKAGRPKSANPKAIKYSIRLDAETEERLEALCEKYDITKGKAIRTAIEMMLDSEEEGRE